jgi:hypothetical protein
MRYFLLATISLAFLHGGSYQVKLFDTNGSKGVWQMIGILGLEDYSTGNNQNDNGGILTPTIPDEDNGAVNSGIPIDLNETYQESGNSEDEMEISKIFDVNLSDDEFSPLSDDFGELAIYSYSKDGDGDRWFYYNSKNSSGANDFETLKKGKAYWARYDNLYNPTSATLVADGESDAGFIFSDSFKLGTESYDGKVADGWNLLSLPEKRTLERLSFITFDFNITSGNTFYISKKNSLDEVNISTSSDISETLQKMNKSLAQYGIFALKTRDTGSSEGNITLISREEFTLEANKSLLFRTFPDISEVESSKTKNSTNLFSMVLDIYKNTLIDLNTSTGENTTLLEVNGKDLNITDFDSLKLSDGEAVFSFGVIKDDGNLTMLFSKTPFFVKQKGYIKRYEENSSGVAGKYNFISIDGGSTVFQLTEERDEVNSSLTLFQNSREHEVVRGFLEGVDFIESLQIDEDGDIVFEELPVAPRYMKTYEFTKTDNLKNFLSTILDGYIPTQILTLQSKTSGWASMPIYEDITDWRNFESSYDIFYSIDKREGYWVKFVQGSNSPTFIIDSNNTAISKDISHQVVEDEHGEKSITNIFRYDIDIYLRNVTKDVRGFMNVGDLNFDLEKRGDILSGSFDFETFYSVDVDALSKIDIVVVDENGFQDSFSIDRNDSFDKSIDLRKPSQPSENLSWNEIVLDQSYRVFEDLESFDGMDVAECKDLGDYPVYVVQTNEADRSILLEKLFISDPIEKRYVSLYKSTSQIESNEENVSRTPVKKFDSSCIEDRNSTLAYEGVGVGNSVEDITLYYKTSDSFDVASSQDFPLMMYVKLNGNVFHLEFDPVYNGSLFYIVDSNEKSYSGRFEADTYSYDQNPLSLSAIE